MSVVKIIDFIFSRIVFSLFAILALQIIVRVASPNESELHLIVLCQSMQILFGSFDMFIYWFRYKNQANITAVYRLIAFGISASWRLFAIAVLKSLSLYVVGIVAETGLFVSFLLVF